MSAYLIAAGISAAVYIAVGAAARLAYLRNRRDRRGDGA